MWRVKEFEQLIVPSELLIMDGRLDLYPSLEKRFIDVRVTTQGTSLQAQGFVGLIPLNDRITLEVVPRVPLANVARLIEISGQAPVQLADVIRLYNTAGDMYPSLAAIYATGLRDALRHISANGLYKEYQRIEGETSFPHGRVQMGPTITRSLARGIDHRSTISYFHRTVDNGVNQCLLYAVVRLHGYVDQIESVLPQRQRQAIRNDLNLCWQALQGVSLDPSERFLDDDYVTGQRPLPTVRAYYRSALDLALTITGRQAVLVESNGGRLRLPSLVVDMGAVFESYLRRLLQARFALAGWHGDILDGNLQPPDGGGGALLHNGEYIKASPDIVFRTAGRYPVLVEVKYKAATGLPPRTDLNQAISYGISYQCNSVVIAQPQSAAPYAFSGLRRLGTIGTLTVYQYALDLAADDPGPVEERFVTELAALTSTNSNTAA